MEIGGFLSLSLLDYPGKLASVVFTIGCNFRCWFCQNRDLVLKNYNNLAVYKEEEVMEKIASAKGMIDGVAITGGEPTIQHDLPEFLKKIKDMGLLVKLDTNGSNPDMLESLIKNKLVDFVAMDVKAPFAKYNEQIGAYSESLVAHIKKSIKLIMESGLDYEFRTTALPTFSKDDFLEIAKQVKGAKLYSLQQYDNANILDESKKGIMPLTAEYLKEIQNQIQASGLVERCEIKNI
ncbi:MAG: anaerobic ribonucleoside-triphosphate reductase activating protein [Candidatus Micrarchaeia archaeon]